MARMNISMKLISFCLPVYNVKKYLNDCILSIIQQDIDKDEYEIICIDDSSTDGSYEVVQNIASHYDQTRVIDLRYYESWAGHAFDPAAYVREHGIDTVLLLGDIRLFLPGSDGEGGGG